MNNLKTTRPIFYILGSDAPSNYASNDIKHLRVDQKIFGKKLQKI